MTQGPIKTALIALAVCCAICWVATLGLFRESGIDSSFQIESGDAWSAFEDGTEPLYPNSVLWAGHSRRLGVPYLLYDIADVPPYTLMFCFTANESSPYTSLTITQLVASFDNGYSDTLVAAPKTDTQQFELDTRGAEYGEATYLRTNFFYPDAITQHDSCWLELSGYMTQADGETSPYHTRIRLEVVNEVHLYPGWLALMLRGL